MKIVHVFFSFKVGGAESMIRDVMNIQSFEHNVTLLIVNNDYDQDLLNSLASKVRVIKFGRPVGSKNPIHALKLCGFLNVFGADVIHSHDQNFRKIFPYSFSPICLTVHNSGRADRIWKRYDMLFGISKSVMSEITEYGIRDASLVPNGIHASKITPRDGKIFNTLFRMVMVSRLDHHQKGHHILFEALSVLNEKFGLTSWSIDIIGDGSSKEYLSKLAVGLGIANQVCFRGKLNREDIYQNLCCYDLFVQPSLYEGFGLTVAEAMAAELPVLVSNIQGPMEVVDNGKYGTVFECGDSSDLASKIFAISNRYMEALVMAKEGREHICQHYDVGVTSRKYLDLYSVLSGH